MELKGYLRKFFGDPETVIIEDASQEVVLHKSSQPRGDVGWDIRLRRRARESDGHYLARVLATHKFLKEKAKGGEL